MVNSNFFADAGADQKTSSNFSKISFLKSTHLTFPDFDSLQFFKKLLKPLGQEKSLETELTGGLLNIDLFFYRKMTCSIVNL